MLQSTIRDIFCPLTRLPAFSALQILSTSIFLAIGELQISLVPGFFVFFDIINFTMICIFDN